MNLGHRNQYEGLERSFAFKLSITPRRARSRNNAMICGQEGRTRHDRSLLPATWTRRAPSRMAANFAKLPELAATA